MQLVVAVVVVVAFCASVFFDGPANVIRSRGAREFTAQVDGQTDDETEPYVIDGPTKNDDRERGGQHARPLVQLQYSTTSKQVQQYGANNGRVVPVLAYW